MQVTALEIFVVPPRWLFLRIETDEGVTGWGEPIVEGRAATVRAAVDELAEYLIGQDPAHRGPLADALPRRLLPRRPGPMSAIAGIDQALWDIKGKALGVPVHELLGGRVRDRMSVYGWIGGDRPQDIVAQAEKAQARPGFTAVKMNATEELH